MNPWAAEDREAFTSPMEPDPLFTPRFTDDSTVLVQVTETQEMEHFTLHAALGT